MSKKKSKTDPEEIENENISFETFSKPGSYQIGNLTDKIPSCFNGIVSIKKYKITIEPIEESNETYTERLQKLWDECDNYRNERPLEYVAKSIGYVLKGQAGSKAKKRY